MQNVFLREKKRYNTGRLTTSNIQDKACCKYGWNGRGNPFTIWYSET